MLIMLQTPKLAAQDVISSKQPLDTQPLMIEQQKANKNADIIFGLIFAGVLTAYALIVCTTDPNKISDKIRQQNYKQK